jgi:hypothetical protein
MAYTHAKATYHTYQINILIGYVSLIGLGIISE